MATIFYFMSVYTDINVKKITIYGSISAKKMYLRVPTHA